MKKCEIIAIANQKGGVGKTTTTVNLGTSLARQGKRVLLIDLDPQANLTMCMGFQSPDELSYTIANVLIEYVDDKITLTREDYLQYSEGCDLVPSSIQLSGIEPSLINALSRERLLSMFLDQYKNDYDYILIDCMPSLGMLTINALVAATSVLIPVQAHYLSAKGLEMLISTISRIKTHINNALDFKGILITMHNERLNFTKAILGNLEKAYGNDIRIFENRIPQSIRAVEHTATGQSVYLYDPKCKVSLAYEAFTKEVLSHG
jgi:chromosome partitioning protein